MKRINEFDSLKVIAVFSIICAHLSPITSNGIFAQKISWLYNMIGILGVPLFFFISGYLFYQNDKRFITFWKKKLIYIVIPWLFLGSICYFGVNIISGLSLTSYIKFVLGIGSYLYYLPVLLLLYFISYFMKDNKSYLIISTWLGLCSLIYSVCTKMTIYNYVNIFNWIIYFNIGLIINKNNVYDKYLNFCQKYKFFFFLVFIFIVIGSWYFELECNYWSLNGIIMIVTFWCFMFGILMSRYFNAFFVFVGKNSLAFYLIHMPIAGIVVRITNGNNILLLSRFFITFLLTYLTIFLYIKVADRMKVSKLKVLIGVKP